MAISRYKSANIKDNYYETSQYPNIDLDNIKTFSIIITETDRLDALAFKYYGSGEYWWVIALVNNIDYFFDIVPGQQIQIPINLDDVLRYF